MNKKGEYLDTRSEGSHWATINGSQLNGHLLEGLGTVLTGWISVNLFVPMTCEPACSQSWNNRERFTQTCTKSNTFSLNYDHNTGECSLQKADFCGMCSAAFKTGISAQISRIHECLAVTKEARTKTWKQASQAYLCDWPKPCQQQQYLKPGGSSGLPIADVK